MNSNFLTIFRRELAAYFNASIAYIFIIVFVLLNGGLFMTQFFLYNRADMRPFFVTLPFILSVFLPAVTMRLWAEEKRGNTLELLLTFPVPTSTLVVGKFLASFVFYLVALAGTLTIPIMIKFIGQPDLGAIASGYMGAALMGAFFLAVGIFISGLCRDQIVAFILSMMICFGLYLVGSDFISASIDGWVPGLGTFFARFIGAADHYNTFGKGVIDNSDLLYFVIGTVVFLVLNGFWFEGRMKVGAKKTFTFATVISVGIFLMANWLLADLPIGRFDLTEGKIYTIAPATKKILKSLDSPVTAKFYVSSLDKMPTQMKSLEQDVVGKLDELRAASGGHFEYKIFHMEAANVVEQAPEKKEGEADSLEKQIQEKGINPFQVRAVESDEVAVRLVYSSISLGYKDKADEIIPRVLPDNLHELEYMLISKIHRMTLETKPKVVIVAPYEEKKMDPQVQAILKQLGGRAPDGFREDAYEMLPMALQYEGYEISRIRLTKEEPIPQGTTTLVIVEPRALNTRQMYEINRFLASGGQVFLSVQNYEYDYQPRGNQLSIFPKPKKPEINQLLSQWGFEVDEQILVDEQHDMINLSGGAAVGPFEMSIPVKIPIQVLVPASGMNPNISVTSRIASIFYLWGTALKLDDSKIKEQNLKVDVLLHSSNNSWTVPFKEGSLNPNDLAQKPEGRIGPFPLAVMVSGQFADVYKASPIVPPWPKPEETEPTDPNDPNAKKPEEPVEPSETPAPLTLKPGKMILIGNSMFLQKHLIRGGGNLSFFMNSVDAISLGEELVTIRSKQPVDRSLGRLSTGAKLSWRIFVTFLIPILFTVLGTLRVLLRQQAKQKYMKSYAESLV